MVWWMFFFWCFLNYIILYVHWFFWYGSDMLLVKWYDSVDRYVSNISHIVKWKGNFTNFCPFFYSKSKSRFKKVDGRMQQLLTWSTTSSLELLWRWYYGQYSVAVLLSVWKAKRNIQFQCHTILSIVSTAMPK